MRRFRTMIFVSVVMLMAATVMAQPGQGRRGMGSRGGGGDGGLGSIVDDLDLTSEQEAVWKGIEKELKASTETSRKKMREMRDQGVDRESDEAREVMSEMRAAIEKAETALLGILDEDQAKKFKEAKASRQESFRKRQGEQGGKGRGGDGQGG